MNAIPLTRIVTCYRQWSLLERWAGNPALRQAGVKWIIVNDDPGTPCPSESASLLGSLGAVVHTVRFNSGRSAARNAGATLSDTPYIEHIDGDDFPLPYDQGVIDQLDGTFDLGAFPVWEATNTVFPPNPPPRLAIQPAWSLFLPQLSPLDVRPAGTLWRNEFFRRLGGYDARFESAEDFQLACRANAAGARVKRFEVPKQCYSARTESTLRCPLFVEGHLRLWHWLNDGNCDAEPDLRVWMGKDTLQRFIHSGIALWTAKQGVMRYLKTKLRI